ncbi:MAG: amino acid ABC transporter substrate-binding protein [Anaerolineales bacterium]|nr:amino acid ABC transporter substrate-binding protein [Anaerolineales bacterium]
MKFSAVASAILFMLIALIVVPTAHAASPAQDLPDPAGDWARVQKAGKLVLGTAADYPPFEFYNSNFELDGFDIALATALGKELGVEVEFNDYAFDGLLDQVKLGNVDAAIAAISVTPERSAEVDFTNLYYIGNGAVVAAPAFTATITSPADMAGFTVGVQLGTTYQAWAQEHLVDAGLILAGRTAHLSLGK